MTRKKGDTAEPDEIYKFFRVTKAGELQPIGTGGGPADKAKCLFCQKEQSCQKRRLLLHLACIKDSALAKPCLGPSRNHEDNVDLTEAEMERKYAGFRSISARMRARFDEENVLKRKAAEVGSPKHP